MNEKGESAMPMDGLTLGFLARELRETLRDGRVERVTQPEKDMLVLLIRAQGKNHRLLLSAAPASPGCISPASPIRTPWTHPCSAC